MAIRIKARQNESASQMLRRFKKLCEKENLIKDVKKRQYFEKPSERKRRATRRTESRIHRELHPELQRTPPKTTRGGGGGRGRQ
jgi:small subunit ribosomal protein S21